MGFVVDILDGLIGAPNNRQDKIRLQGWMQIIREGIRMIWTEIRTDSANRHIDLSHLPGITVCFLTIDRYSASGTAMSLKEFCALHKHTAGATAGICDQSNFDTKEYGQCL